MVDELIESNPFDAIRLNKIVAREQLSSKFKADAFSVDEIEAILAACDRPQVRNMLQFAFSTGMRPSEYIALSWSAVSFDANQIWVEAALVVGEVKDTAKTEAALRIALKWSAVSFDASRIRVEAAFVDGEAKDTAKTKRACAISTCAKARPARCGRKRLIPGKAAWCSSIPLNRNNGRGTNRSTGDGSESCATQGFDIAPPTRPVIPSHRAC